MKSAVQQAEPASARLQDDINFRLKHGHAPRPEVRCSCGHTLFDGLMIKARALRILDKGAQAKCKRCKEWVAVPLSYSA